MTSDERALMDRVQRNPSPQDVVRLSAIVRRLDAENERMRAELTRLLDIVTHDEDFDGIKRAIKGGAK